MPEIVPLSEIQEETIISLSEIQEETQEAIPTKDIKPKVDRPSDPGKRILSGLSKSTISGIPVIAGLVGAGIETLAKYPFNLAFTDKGFVDTFKESLSSGADKLAFDLGLDIQKGVTKGLGIPLHAVSTEDQAAELLGSLLIPVPAGFLGGAAAKGAAGIAGKAATLLTPAVRLGPKGNLLNLGVAGQATFPTRAGVQLGIGSGIEQGIRAVEDHPDLPLLLSARAIHGDIATEGGAGDDTLEGGAGDDTLPRQVSLSDIKEEQVSATIANTIPLSDIQSEEPGPISALVRTNEIIEEEEHSNLVRNIALATLSLAGVFFGAKISQKLIAGRTKLVSGLEEVEMTSGLEDAINTVKNKNVTQGIKAAGQEAKEQVGAGAKRGEGNVFDATLHSETHLRGVGVPEEEIAEVVGEKILDPFGATVQFLKDGKFGQGSDVVVRALKNIKQEFDDLTPQEQQQFIDGIAFTSEDITRTRATAFDAIEKFEAAFPSRDKNAALRDLREAFETGTIDDIELILKEQESLIKAIRGTDERVKSGLFNWIDTPVTKGGVKTIEKTKQFIDDLELNTGLERFNANPQFVRMQKDLARINEAVLDEAVRHGVADAKWATAMKQQFTKNGKVLYLPGKESFKRAAWYKRLAVNMGLHTTEGKKLNGVANWHLKGLVEGEGIQSPLNPFEATADYALNVIQHTSTSIRQWNVLSRLTGLKLDENGVASVVKPRVDDTLRPTTYVGSSSLDDPFNRAGQIHVNFHDDPIIASRFGTKEGATFTPQQLAEMNDVIWVQRGSTYHGFLVADKQLKKGLEFDAALHNRVLKFGNFWKNLFTKFTTGNLSPFGITSFMYNNQISSFNALLRASSKEGATIGSATREAFETWKDSYKGAWEVTSVRLSEEFADIFAQSIKNNSAFYRAYPKLVEKIQQGLAKKVSNSLVGPLQRETGKFHSSLAASEFQGNITNIMEEVVPHVSGRYGANALPRMWRIWNHLNAGMHEGTALGITMRKSAEAALKNPKAAFSTVSKQGRRDAADIVGDVRLRGSSDTVKAFHAITPFSGAMMQAWSTMGRAISKAGPTKTIGAITAVVGIPTALEVTYNSSLDDEQTWADPDPLSNKRWNYREYYWKGFNSDQRNNNHIIFKPGAPPWEALLVPVTPELSLFRGVVIDGMELIFGMSEHGIEHGNHLLASAVRVFDIPLNPFLSAAGNAVGLDLKTGLLPDDLDAEGFSFLQGRQLFTGGRITGTAARTKYEGGELDKDTVAILQSLFGAGGTLAVGVYESFNAGNERTPLNTKLEFAFDSLGRNVQRQTRMGQGLVWGKSLRSTVDRHASRALLLKKGALQRAAKGLEAIESGGTQRGGIQSRGDAISFTADPTAQLLAASAGDFLEAIKPFDEVIKDLRFQVNQLGAATVDRYKGEQISVKQREDIIDSLNLRIGAYQDQQLSILKTLEDHFIDTVMQTTGKDISGFEFNNFTPAVTPPSLASPGLQRLPQTSR